jgi:branched-subunit amino acid transport protein
MIVALLVLAVGTYAMKAVGPLLSGGRELPPTLARLTDLLPAAMLAALVATQTVVDGTTLVLDARIVGVGAAGVAVALRAPFAVVVLVGAGVTALVRAAGWG